MGAARWLICTVVCGGCSLRGLDYLHDGARDGGDAGTLDGGSGCPAPQPGLLADVTAISAHTSHACALQRDGGVFCWGLNTSAQTGTPASAFVARPSRVQAFGAQHAVATGLSHACALDQGGLVRCWGWGINGAVGGVFADNTEHALPVVVPALPDGGEPMRGSAVAAGEGLDCVLDFDGGVSCCGLNSYGATGVDPAMGGEGRPFPVAGTRGASALLAGDGFACAATATDVRCWGLNSNDELGRTTTDTCGGATACAWTVAPAQLPVEFRHPARALGGASSPCAIDADGALWCWGSDRFRRTGEAPVGVLPRAPHRVAGMPAVVAVAGSTTHTCAATEAGQIACVGTNRRGQLGPGVADVDGGVSAPAFVVGVSDAIGVAAGDDFSCAVGRCGEAWCWGTNDRGQLGAGDAGAISALARVVAP